MSNLPLRPPRNEDRASVATHCGMAISALVVVFAVMLVSAPAQAAIPLVERQVLLDLYAETNGANWAGVSPPWGSALGTECTWGGVTCDGTQSRVTEIALPRKNLRGPLPATLNQLTSLRRLDLSRNRLTGPIPSVTGLVNLQELLLSRNTLSGSIPSLAGLSKLESFNVSTNQLTGAIPALTGLTSLRSFDVSFNRLTGAAPAVPSPNRLLPAQSALCVNLLDARVDAAWDAATGLPNWALPCLYSITVTPAATPNGSVFPSTPQLVGSYGAPIVFDLEPDPGYGAAVTSNCAGGGYGGTSYAVTVIDNVFVPPPGLSYGDCDVTPTFSNQRVNVAVSSSGPGSVTPIGVQNLLFGSFMTLTTAPAPGHRPVLQSNCSAGQGFTRTGNLWTAVEPVQRDCAVSIAFTPEYVVTPVAGAHGHISPDTPQLLLQGESTSFEVLPDAGYRVASVVGCNTQLSWTAGRYAYYRVDPVTASCSMVVTFVLIGADGAQPVPVNGPRFTFALLLLLSATGLLPLLARRQRR